MPRKVPLHKIVNFSALVNQPWPWSDPDEDWFTKEGLERIAARGPLHINEMPWGTTRALQPGYSYCGVRVSDKGHWGGMTKYGCGLIQRTVDLVESTGCMGGYHGHLCEKCMVWENEKLEFNDELSVRMTGDIIAMIGGLTRSRPSSV